MTADVTSDQRGGGPANERVDRRLRTQHARWLLHQTDYVKSWKNRVRPFLRRERIAWRRLRWAATECAKWVSGRVVFQAVCVTTCCVSLVAAIGLLGWGIWYFPSAAALSPIPTLELADEQRTELALVRVAAVLAWGMLQVWLIVPGIQTSHRSWSGYRSPDDRNRDIYGVADQTFRKRSCATQINARVLLICLGAFTVPVFVATLKVLWTEAMDLGFACLMVSVATAFLCSSVFLVWALALRMQRVRSPNVGTVPLSLWVWMVVFFGGILFFGLTLSEAGAGLLGRLPWAGPFGLPLAMLWSLAAGSVWPAVGLLSLSGVFVWLGIAISQRELKWENRRKVVLAHRRIDPWLFCKPDEADELSGVALTYRIRSAIDQASLTSRWRVLSTWVFPNWFAKTWPLYVILLPFVLAIQVNYYVLWRMARNAPETRVIGGSVPSLHADWGAVFSATCLGGWMLLFLATEFMGLDHESRHHPLRSRERVRDGWGIWFDVQLDGLYRLPFQFLLCLPPAILWFLSGQATTFGIAALVVLLITLTMVLGRSLYSACYVMSGAREYLSEWFRYGMGCCLIAATIAFAGAVLQWIVLVTGSRGFVTTQLGTALVFGLYSVGLLYFASVGLIRHWQCRERTGSSDPTPIAEAS